MQIICDVDGVLAGLDVAVLERYNADYGDTLTPEQLTGWGIEAFVKPECGARINEYFQHADLYDRVQPIPGAVNGVRRLREAGHSLLFASACYYGMVDQKARWLERHTFCAAHHDGHLPADFIPIRAKWQLTGVVLIDDGAHNIREWVTRTRRPAIVVDQPHNQDLGIPTMLMPLVSRARTWDEVVAHVDLACSFPFPSSPTR